MAIPDSSAIDAALATRLGSDAQLLALMPNGIYWDEAMPGATAFVLVSLVVATDTPIFGGRGFETVHYTVRAVELSTRKPTNSRLAAYRIDQLLEDATLTIPGYGCLIVQREERIRHVEPDPLDATLRWFHRGGRYLVMAAPLLE